MVIWNMINFKYGHLKTWLILNMVIWNMINFKYGHLKHD